MYFLRNVSIVLVVASFMFMLGCSGEAQMRWECQATGTSSMQCSIENNGNEAGKVCFDVVAVCSDGEHVARVCSSVIKPGELEQKVVRDFNPPITYNTQCQGFEYRNEDVTVH